MVTIPMEIARRFGVILPRKSVERLFGSPACEGSALGWCADLR